MDARKEGLKKGLRQLTIHGLKKILEYPHEMVLDDCNYKDGKFCPLAVACNLDSLEDPTDEKIVNILEGAGLSVYNTRGLKGEFYTTNRKEDLITAVKEVIAEKAIVEKL